MPTDTRLHLRHRELVARLSERGVGGLDLPTRTELGTLLVMEARKGAFPIEFQSDQDLVAAFTVHVQREFADDPGLKVAIDYSPQIRQTARELASRTHPVEAVILYATWIEHWLNGILLTIALRSGMAEPDARQMIRDANMPAKLGWVWRSLQLPPLSDTVKTRLSRLSGARNQYLHYKWPAFEPDVLDGKNPQLSQALDNIEDTLDALVDYDLDHVSGDAIRVADRIFDIRLRDAFRDAARSP